MCPDCKGKTAFDFKVDFFRCEDCDWFDISEPAIFYCDWCGNEELEKNKHFTNSNEEICKDCINLI